MSNVMSIDNEKSYERHFQPKELAKLWSFSEDVIRGLFEKEPGVLRLENPATRSKRRYTSIRIPQSVADRVYRRLTAKHQSQQNQPSQAA